MIRGLLWLLPRIPYGLWGLAKLLWCFIVVWHDYDNNDTCKRCGYWDGIGQ